MACNWFQKVPKALEEQRDGVSAENARVRKSERGLGARSKRKQSWKDSVGPACKGWDSVLSSLPGREVPVSFKA